MVTQIIESRFQWFTILSRIDSIISFLINDNYRCRHCFTLQLVSFRWEPMLSNAKPIVKYQLRNNTYFRLIIFLRLKPLAITDPKIYLLILLPTSKPIHRDLHSDEPAYLIYPQYYWKSIAKRGSQSKGYPSDSLRPVSIASGIKPPTGMGVTPIGNFSLVRTNHTNVVKPQHAKSSLDHSTLRHVVPISYP